MKIILAAVFYATMAVAGGLLVMWTEQHRPMSTYVSPRLCYNGDDIMETDVCSKIGKQWPI